MRNEATMTFRLRLEDAVALVFFIINLALRIIFRGLERRNLSPADVFIIIPAVTLLLAKELVQYFVGGKAAHAGPADGIVGFVRPYWRIVRDWFPFLVVLMMYYSFWGDAALLMMTTDRDDTLIAWDQKLFGFQASVALQRFVNPSLTAWMQFAYTYHVWNIPVVACFIYVRRSRERFREMMCGLLVVCFIGLLGYLLVPAIGPIYTLREQFTVPLTQPIEVFNRQMEFMDFARIKRDVFPSMHVAISFVVWLYAYRNSRKLFWILSPIILSLFVSTLYLRYHYLVDVVAGLILAPLSFALANWMFKRYGEIPFSVNLPGALVSRYPWLGSASPKLEVAEKVEEPL